MTISDIEIRTAVVEWLHKNGFKDASVDGLSFRGCIDGTKNAFGPTIGAVQYLAAEVDFRWDTEKSGPYR